MYYKIAQLMLTPGKKASTTSDIYIAQPDAIKESLAGKLFILAEIESKKIDSLKITNFLIDNINYYYYQDEKIILREKITTLKIEHIFETALSKINKNFAEFLSNERIKINLSSINITIGIIHENMLHITNAGKNKVFLFYKSRMAEKQQGKNLTDKSGYNNLDEISLPRGEYKIFEITRQTAVSDDKKLPTLKTEGDKNNSKLFSNIISGQIPQKSHFLITNEALPEYISNQQLINIITALPPISAVEQLKNILSKINAYVSFLGIIVKSTALEKPKDIKRIAPLSTYESIIDLNRTEETTESLLTPSGIINFKKWKNLSFFLIKPRKKTKEGSQNLLMLKDKIFVQKKSLSLVKKTYKTIKNTFIYLVNILFYLLKSFSTKENLVKLFSGLKYKIIETEKKYLSLFKNLNQKNKILLVFAVFFLLIFIFNLSLIKIRNEKNKQMEAYKDLSALIEKKQNQAEANLLYSNEDGAKKLFTEIENLMRIFPQDTDEQKKQLSQFQKKFNFQLEKIRRVERIDNPPELANFINLNSQAKPENIFLVESVNKIYSADSSQKSIYILDISSNLITTLTDLEQPIVNLKLPTVGLDQSIYYFNNTNIIELETGQEKMNSLSINIIGHHYDFISSDTYNNRLYLLNAKDSQIYRYHRVGNGFSSPYSWLKEKVDLTTAVDMSIDGHIYILKNNGQILKLLRGKTVDFTLEQPDPPLEKPSKLFVSPELKYIYVLEPAAKRLILFDKTGQFLMQYQSDKFTDLKDFIVDEKNKILYFLNNTSVFGFTGVHFEE